MNFLFCAPFSEAMLVGVSPAGAGISRGALQLLWFQLFRVFGCRPTKTENLGKKLGNHLTWGYNGDISLSIYNYIYNYIYIMTYKTWCCWLVVAGASAELPHTLMLAHVKASFMSGLDMLGGWVVLVLVVVVAVVGLIMFAGIVFQSCCWVH